MWGFVNNVLNAVIPKRKAFETRNEILAKYGDPGAAYANKYCITVNVKIIFPWFPEATIFINKEFWGQLLPAFQELEQKGLHKEIKTFDGCYNIRNTRGTGLISLHAWAMAIDMNASVEKLGQTYTNWSDEFIAVMRKYVYWGGDFRGRRDNMHFSLYGE
jgi:hypothetical protein